MDRRLLGALGVVESARVSCSARIPRQDREGRVPIVCADTAWGLSRVPAEAGADPGPRVLRIEYRDLPGVSLHLDVGGASSAEIDGSGTSRWVVKEVALGPNLPDLFMVVLINRGSQRAAVSRLEVGYLACRESRGR
jgi:hypothetical protein